MPSSTRVPPAGIFKAYDVRGLYGSEIDGETAYLIGRGFARVLARLRDKPSTALRVGLGRDMRLQSPEISGRFRDGLLDGDIDPRLSLVDTRHPTRYSVPDGH